MKLEDTPEFEEIAEKQQVTKSPLLDTVTKNPWSVARVVGVAIAKVPIPTPLSTYRET